MSDFISIPVDELENVPELDIIRETSEVELEITDVKFGIDKNGNNYFMPRFAATTIPDTKTFTKFFGYPHNGQKTNERNNSIRSIRDFYKAFGIDYSQPVGLEQLIGATGWALVGSKIDGEYGEQNFIKRFIGKN